MNVYQPRDIGAELANSITSPFVQSLMGGMQQRQQDLSNTRKMEQESAFQKALAEQKFGHQQALQEQEYGLKGGLEREKQQIGQFEDASNRKTLEKNFGPTFADIYEAAPVGGRTELIKNALHARERGVDLEKVLGPQKENLIQKAKKEKEMPERFPEVNEFEGLTKKEEFSLKKDFRKENKDIFKDSTDKLAGYKSEQRLLNILDELNPELPEGLERMVINPSTGEPYALAQLTGVVPPKVQRFVKTVNDFTTKAKETFGSRVTNFDLERFMSRLPSLLNTKEGRQQIINQMKTVNDIYRLYYGTLKEVYQKYGLDNISQERAEEITDNLIKDDLEKLEAQLSQADQDNSAPKSIKMIGPDGQSYNIPSEHAEKARSKGFKPA
jgi:hypothetical protein